MAGGRKCQPARLLPKLGPQAVTPVLDAVEHARDRGMFDRIVAIVDDQVLLADVSDVTAFRILGQKMVERLVLRRPKGLGNCQIPFLTVGKFRVNVKDHAAEVEDFVAEYDAKRASGMSNLRPMGPERLKASKRVIGYYLGNSDARC